MVSFNHLNFFIIHNWALRRSLECMVSIDATFVFFYFNDVWASKRYLEIIDDWTVDIIFLLIHFIHFVDDVHQPRYEMMEFRNLSNMMMQLSSVIFVNHG